MNTPSPSCSRHAVGGRAGQVAAGWAGCQAVAPCAASTASRRLQRALHARGQGQGQDATRLRRALHMLRIQVLQHIDLVGGGQDAFGQVPLP